MANVKVLIVEDHLMVRMGLSLVLEKIGDIDLIGEFFQRLPIRLLPRQ